LITDYGLNNCEEGTDEEKNIINPIGIVASYQLGCCWLSGTSPGISTSRESD
jgi:hypothetical protein